jgi:hypothetical protein
VAADFKRDGNLDIATGNQDLYLGPVTILLGNGNGTFSSIQSGSITDTVQGLVAADFNTDGKPDIAVAAGNGGVAVLLGNGDGTFMSPVGYLVSDTDYSIAVGDFNSDGKLDLAVGMYTAATVLLGNGDGTFQNAVNYSTPCASASEFGMIAVGDVNSDGQLDLIQTAPNCNAVYVFPGHGDGTFSAPISSPLPPQQLYSGSLVVADFNGDGKLDLALTNYYKNSVLVLLGNGDGTFQPAVSYATSPGPDSVLAADFNGDGKLDLVVASGYVPPSLGLGSGQVSQMSILLGNGDGTFQPFIAYGFGGEYSVAVAGDFNNDGLLDFAVGDGISQSLALFLQDGVTLSPTIIGLGVQPVGTISPPQIVQLSTNGTLSITSITTSTEFAQTNNCGSSLPAGGSCQIIVTFTPSTTGLQNGTLTISDSGVGSPQTARLSGTGTVVATTTTIASSSNPAIFEQSITFIATVTPKGSGTPTGTVTFSDGSTPLGSSPLNAGIATFSTAVLAVGLHSINAVYSGDSNFSGSSGSLSQSVNRATTTTTLTSSVNPSGLDQPVTLTATITPQYGGQASGTVTVKDGATTLGSEPVSGNAASITTSGLAVGTHSITAVYSGDSNFTGSASNALSQVVTKATTTTTLLSSINPSVQGKSVTFTAAVSSLAGTPTGKVKFPNGTAVLATVTLTSGSAKYTNSKLPAGSNSITAVYEGDANNNGSMSSPVNQFVIAATTTTLTSSPNPSIYGLAVAFTATVISSIGSPPDGEIVTFKQGTTELGVGTLSSGTATFSDSTLAVGTKSIKAVYVGDANFASSTSKAVGQVISKATSTTTLASSLNPSKVGQSVTFTASVVPQFSGKVTGTVTFYDGTTALKIGSLSGGVASYTTSTLAIGTHSITATYNGSTSFDGSSSAPLIQTVN